MSWGLWIAIGALGLGFIVLFILTVRWRNQMERLQAGRTVPAKWEFNVRMGSWGTEHVTLLLLEKEMAFRPWIVREIRDRGVTGGTREWPHFTRKGALNRIHWLAERTELMVKIGEARETP